MLPRLHLICGLPGSGKTTLALKLEEKFNAVRFSPDEWILRIVGDVFNENARASIEAVQADLAFRVLALGLDVILENGFWKRSERDSYRRRAVSCGASMQLYYMDVPRERLKSRIIARNASARNSFYIPPESICMGGSV